MRPITRPHLKQALMDYLRHWQDEVDQGANVAATWKSQRRTVPMGKVEQVLESMTGLRERCMYCEDSRGTDIEHFWPKERYAARVFQWSNLLLACAACNRSKGDRFPLDSAGAPLLIDPTADDPWLFLFYAPETDQITARWNPESGEENPQGKETLRILAPLNYQAVSEGRRRTRRNLERAVHTFLERQEGVEEVKAVGELVDTVRDNDDYGLAIWFFYRDGQEESPFRQLRDAHPRGWQEVVGRLQLE